MIHVGIDAKQMLNTDKRSEGEDGRWGLRKVKEGGEEEVEEEKE